MHRSLLHAPNPFHTTYDGNNNLTRVVQVDGSVTQERRFKYDGLSRLTHTREVEAIPTLNDDGQKIGSGGLWTGVFKYNNENELIEAVDARGVRTLTNYDGLGRIVSTSYAGEVGYRTPAVTYTYDESAAGLFNKGRMTGMHTASDAEYGIPETRQTYGYDKAGRITKHSQSIGNKTYELEYGYNLAGHLVSEKYPSGRILTSTLNDAGIVRSIADGQRAYVNAVTFNSGGQLSEMSLGNGDKETFVQNDRLQLVSHVVSRGGEVLQRYDYSFGTISDLANGQVDTSKNNGQLSKVESWIGGSMQWSQRYGYDQLGRVQEVREYKQGINSQLTYKQVFDYDRYGNLYRKFTRNPLDGQANPLPTVWIESGDVDRTTNRFAANTTYDERGNVLVDSKFRMMNFMYDANSRLVGAARPEQPLNLTVYDGTGNRVAEKVGDVWRHMVYDIFGHVVAEYGVAAEGRGGVKYLHQDRQGSVRLVTNSNGYVVSRMDYQTFGAEIGAGVGLRSSEQGYRPNLSSRHGYAGTEKDAPTGLDHTWFRKLENQAGRWTSPDPYAGAMNVSDPQSFNRYSYVTNDPVNYVDPAGLYEACVHEAMTKYLGRLANLAPAVADKLGSYAGDDEGGADSFEYSATNPANVAKCALGAGPNVIIHFPDAAQLAANIRNYSKYLKLGMEGHEAYYQQAGHMLHSIQDALGAHKGYSNRGCKGHARHGTAPDRLIGDENFIAAANKVLQVMSGDPNRKLTKKEIKELINKVLEACKGIDIKVAPQQTGGGSPREGGGRVYGLNALPWWYASMWAYLDDIDAIEIGGGTVTVSACVGSDCENG